MSEYSTIMRKVEHQEEFHAIKFINEVTGENILIARITWEQLGSPVTLRFKLETIK